MDSLNWLQEWYQAQCDGDWEHSYGVEITTLDNPGWALKIHLDETALEERAFEKIEIHRSSTDWLQCRVSSAKIFNVPGRAVFQAACGANNLSEVLEIFQSWAQRAAAG